MSLRSGHHAALRAAGVAQQAQRTLASDAPTWTELRAAARRLLQNLGDLPNLDRPLLTYTADQLAHLLQGQGIEVGRLAVATGAAAAWGVAQGKAPVPSVRSRVAAYCWLLGKARKARPASRWRVHSFKSSLALFV